MSNSRKRQGIAAAVVIVIMVGTAIASAGCGSKADAAGGTQKLTEADNGTTVTLKVGDSIQVVLGGNPTTGYSWATTLTDADKVILQQQGDAVYAQQSTDPSIVGAGGTFTFTFKAAAVGQVALKLGYARPFESVPPIQTVSITIVVK